MSLTLGMTARELLALIGGREHELHTVVGKRTERDAIRFYCSCGARFAVARSKDNDSALRNVHEEPPVEKGKRT